MSRVFVLNENLGPRVSCALAAEIGLKESLIFLQIEYWVSHSGNERDGLMWTYQSLTDFQTQFPFMGRETINRVLARLQGKRLIHVTSKYNQRAGDKTRWFAINPLGCESLSSIRLVSVRKTLSHYETANGDSLAQNETRLSQNETTLPNDLPNDRLSPHIHAGEEDPEPEPEEVVWDTEMEEAFDDWIDSGVEVLDPQPFLMPSLAPKEKKLKRVNVEPIPKGVHSVMYRLCFRADTDAEQMMLSSTQRGKVASVLGQLRDAGADFTQLARYEQWWVENWRSKDRANGQYQAPRPEQVLEHWTEAMKSGVKPSGTKIHKPEPDHEVRDLGTIMTRHRETK